MKDELVLLRVTFGISMAISVLGLVVGSESQARVQPAPPAPADVIARAAPTTQLSAEEEYLLQRCGPTTDAHEHIKCRRKAMAEMQRAQQRARKVHHRAKPVSSSVGKPKSPGNAGEFDLDDYLLPEHRAPTNR